MFKIIAALLMIFLASPAHAFYSSGHWQETTCEICGTRIYSYVEPSYPGFLYAGESMVTSLCPDPKRTAYFINIQSFTVCEECQKKYRKLLQFTVDQWLKELQELLSDIREKNNSDINKYNTGRVQREIEKLEKDLEILRSKECLR